MKAGQSTELEPYDNARVSVGDMIMLRLPNGDIKALKIEKDSTISLGKIGSFHANELLGQPYGLTFEIQGKKLKALSPRTLQEVEDTEATNELINDGESVQPLTIEEIQQLKLSGVHVSDIIKKQIEQHANYSLKTEYSKDKYKKRKEAKYSKSFTTVEPTIYNVCEYWYNKDHDRVRDIRTDSLSQILNLANIRPGGRYIAVDEASGLIVSAILARLGGAGRLVTICDVDSPPAYPVMHNMNFKSSITSGVLSSLNWATADEEYIPIEAPSNYSQDQIKSERQKSRLNKRKAVSDALSNTREVLFEGEFESLVIASQYDPWSILERLSPYLAGSAAIVVHSPYVQILSDLQTKMRGDSKYLSPTVTEPWLRRYQILPGRTHPTMNTSGSGGYILHAIRVYDDPNAEGVVYRDSKRKKMGEPEDSSILKNTSDRGGADAEEPA